MKDSILNSSSTLYYLKGNCTWKLTVNLGMFTAEDVSVGPWVLLESPDTITRYEITCKVNNSVRLHAEVTVLGELSNESRVLCYTD